MTGDESHVEPEIQLPPLSGISQETQRSSSPTSAPFTSLVTLAAEQNPGGTRIRDGMVLVGLTALLDYLFYQGTGALSFSVAIIVIPICMALFAPGRKLSGGAVLFGILIALVSLRFAWQMNPGLILVGAALLVMYAVALNSGRSDIPLLATSFLPTCAVGAMRLIDYAKLFPSARLHGLRRDLSPDIIKTLALPAAIVSAFAAVFLLSNPILRDLVNGFYDSLQTHTAWFWEAANLHQLRISFWGFCLWSVAALWKPLVLKPDSSARWVRVKIDNPKDDTQSIAEFQIAFNTLIGLNVLFAAYNALDAYHLLVRESLPPGLNHSQYAHQGVLWLTVALAMSTFVLSRIFLENLNFHPKQPRLLRLAELWMVQNFALALWLLLRLDLYIDYNGLTRMRLVGFTGTFLVVFGFVLVIIKVERKYSLFWLIRRQLTAFAITIVLLTVTPLDSIVWWVNTPLILEASPPRAAYQLANQPLSSEALPMILPLLDHPDPIIARGAAALLGQWYFDDNVGGKYMPETENKKRWTRYQFGDAWCRRSLEAQEARIRQLVPNANWFSALDRLREHTKRWI